MTASLERTLRDLTTSTTLRVQPVPPEQPTLQAVFGTLVGSIGAVLLGAWFVCLGTLSAHTVWPAVPALGYWPAVGMLLALGTIGHTVRGGAWKWARR